MDQKEYDYFSYLDKSIGIVYCSNNGLHNDMHKLSKKGDLITFGKPINAANSVDISKITMENDSTLDNKIAYYSAEQLRESGLPLPIGLEKKYKEKLIVSYILKSSLCYVEVIGKNDKQGFFATKSYSVVSALYDNLAETEHEKKESSFKVQLANTLSEIGVGKFSIIKLTSDVGGLKLSKCKINCNNKSTTIIPMYSIDSYITNIITYISANIAHIKYMEDGIEKNLITTLVPGLLAKWLNTANKEAIRKVAEGWINPFFFGEIILPDICKTKEFVTVPVLGIKSIKPLD